MEHTNCRQVVEGRKIVEGPHEVQDLEEGWVGVKNGKLLFRPSRGSGGFALYSTGEQAKRFTGASDARFVSLRVVF